MAVVCLALGSNVGDSVSLIRAAIEMLSNEVTEITRAPLYRSRAAGYSDQPDFINTAVAGSTTLSPHELLKYTQSVEKVVGRIERFRWGPREIDIDIILYDDLILKSPEITIPHSRFRERDFVLRPLSDIAPGFVDPVSGYTILGLLKSLPDDSMYVVEKIMQ